MKRTYALCECGYRSVFWAKAELVMDITPRCQRCGKEVKVTNGELIAGPMETKGLSSKPKEHKSFPSLSTKVVDADQGIVEHIINVFGILDHGHDISHPGSFTKTLRERGTKTLVLDSHGTDSVLRVIAKPIDIKEIDREQLPPEVLAEYPEATGGVWARTQFLLNTPEGKGVFERIKADALREWSFGYDPLDFDFSTVKGDEDQEIQARNLRTIRLYEYSPVLWGMNPATTVLDAKDAPAVDAKDASTVDAEDESNDAKEDKPPEEAKPEPDVTENTIRIRVRDPKDFQQDSFRTINIGDEDNGIQAVIGRPDGKDTTEIQSYIFDKEKFTTESAQAWVDDHKDSEPSSEVKEDDMPPEEKDSAKEMTEHGPQQRLGDVLTGAIHRTFTNLADQWIIEGMLTQEQRIQMSSLIGDALDVINQGLPEEVANMAIWAYLPFLMTAELPDGTKIGRRFSGATVESIQTTISGIQTFLTELGTLIAPVEEADVDTEDTPAPDKREGAPSPDKVADLQPDDQAGTEPEPPTSKLLLIEIEQELLELELLED